MPAPLPAQVGHNDGHSKMPLLNNADPKTFDMHGVRFAPIASPSRGARESAMWRAVVAPHTEGVLHHMTREEIIQRMQQAHRRVLQEVWERRMQDLPVKTPEQLVTLASIVEKETGRPDERTRVAAVFVNRLKSRMRLQSDPTIIYGLTGGKGSLGRPILKSEIEQPTPYNTYVVDGLPPGPIANPGRASLEAAANPARTKELYFVADGTGGHVFSENYTEHQKNVARLRGIEHGTISPPASGPQGGTKQ